MRPDQANILVVDDSEANRDVLSRRLTRQGHHVEVAEDGREALELMKDQDFDLILLDIMMPEMNGFQVLEHLHADPRLRHVPVIVVSALDDTDSIVKCIQMGAEDHLTKPINSVILRARVDACLEKKWLRDQEQAYLAAIRREMELGRQIQADFLPSDLPQPPGWQIATFFHPAYEVAGDFFDVFTLPDERLGLILADVSGKGVGAALFMALTRSLLRAFSDQNTASSADTLRAVSLTNNYIIRHHQHQAHMFVTLFFGVLGLDTGTLMYVNAGHLPPVLIRSSNARETLDPTGPLVGVTLDIPFQIKQTRLDPGDILLAFTDGITEATDPDGHLFGMDRLLSTLAQPAPSAGALLELIEAGVRAHVANGEFSDDVAMLAARRTPL